VNEHLQTVPTGPTRDHALYLGGSDIAAIVGASPYKTALDLWAERTGRVPPFAGNAKTELGDHLERPLVELYARRCGVRELVYPGTLTHPTLEHIGATPDAVADSVRTVQVKVVGVPQARRWGEPEDGANGIPLEVLCQVSFEAALARVCGVAPGDRADVVAQIGTDLRVYPIAIDPGFGDDLIAIADAWWREHVIGGAMPHVEDGSTSIETLRVLDPRIQVAPDDVIALAKEYVAHRADESEAKRHKKAIAAQLCEYIGDRLGFVSPTQDVKVTWDERASGTDWKRLAARYRDLLVRERSARFGALASFSDLDTIEADCAKNPTRTLNVHVKGQ